MRSREPILLSVVVPVFAGLALLAGTWLWWGCDTDLRSEEKQFANAIQVGERKRAERLIARNPKLLRMKDRYERTPLHVAVGQKQLDMIQFLVKQGADVNARDNQNRTPMYYAWGDGVAARIREMLRLKGGVGAFAEPNP